VKKALIIFSSLMVCIFLFFSCTSGPSTTATSSHPTTTTTTTTTPAVPRTILKAPNGTGDLTQTPEYGGTMKEIWGAHPSNLGAPWNLLSGPNKMISRYAIEYLNSIDSQAQPVPQLATSWVSDTAKKTLTFELRTGVKFHDGSDFNAEAVKWNLDMSIAKKNPAMALVSSVDIVDNTHVRVNFTAWDPLFLNSLLGNSAGAMASMEAAKKLIAAGKEADIALTPVGTGPFKFVSFVPDVSVKFTKNTGYWQTGLPYLDGVEISLVYDATVALTSFKKGEVHYLEGVLPKDVKGLKAEGYKITQMTSAIFGMAGDSANPTSPFADKRLRQAIAYALDLPTIVNSVFVETYPAVNQWASVGGLGYDSSIQGYPYNVDKAKALLAELNISAAHPLNVKFTFAEGPMTKDFYVAVQSYLAKVGINLEFDIITGSAWNTFRTQTMTNQMSEYNMTYMLEFTYSDTLKQSAMKDSSWYKSVWTSDAYNALVQKMLPESDLTKRADYYKQLNKMLVDDCHAIPTFLKLNFKAMQANLMDMNCGNVANEFLPEIVWLKK